MAIWRLLLSKGADPFLWDEESPVDGFPWKDYFEEPESLTFLPELFEEMCKLATSDSSDDGDLFDVLDIACSRGRYTFIHEMRTRAKSRIDVMIREKAAFFLQKLLLNLSDRCEDDLCYHNFRSTRQMDEAIDTIGLLILEVGPSSTLTASCQLGEEDDDDGDEDEDEDLTALKLIKGLLVTPGNPHNKSPSHGKCDCYDQRQYKTNWCLKQRLELHSNPSGNPTITILGRRIAWPSQWTPLDFQDVREEDGWDFDWIHMPWDCPCFPHHNLWRN
ncbi:hypothetical protein PG994_006755 [Apiospora phragmitis]|uniref:Uncharacterized protein n=1 Tax=Apiospora phragmitis TaxID=2905665 RepID=A0ABR1VFX9_9PEZI